MEEFFTSMEKHLIAATVTGVFIIVITTFILDTIETIFRKRK